jgi:parallel beta-helix repeat protein
LRAERWLLAAAISTLAAVPAPVTAPVPAPAGGQTQCADARVHCVGLTANSEHRDIQHAVDAARPGDVVWVDSGEYSGFRVRRGGTIGHPVRIVAAPDVVITGPEPYGAESIYLENVSWVVLEGFVVEHGGRPGHGIGAHDASAARPMRGLVIRNNIVRDAGISNIYLSQVADSLIEGNIAAGARGEHGIYLSNAGSDNTVIRGNSAYDNAVNGIHFNGDDRYGGDGVHTGLVVDGNIFYRNRANGLDIDGVRSSSFVNNVVFHNGRHGFRAFAIDAAAGPADLVVANNTIVDNGGWAMKLTQDDGGHTIFNNILLSASGSLVVDNTRFVSDHNVVNGPFSIDGESTVVSFDRWRGLGFGGASFAAAAEALFVAPQGGDFRLAKDSPAVAMGTPIFHTVAAPATDLAGASRATVRPSIGALAAAGEREARGR